MKCMNCQAAIPPTFAKAIMDNSCPACGREILSANDFRELLRIRGLLQDLDLEENVVVSVAAAISQKFDLVVKGQKRVAAAPIPKDFENMEGLSEEEKSRLRALQAVQEDRVEEREVQIRQEWFPSDDVQGGEIDPELISLFEAKAINTEDPIAGLPLDRNAARLARAEALKSDPTKFKIMRAE